MELKFRHGIVRHQVDVAGTATFVKKSGNNSQLVDLVCDNAPVVFTIAHGNNNYLVQFDRTVSGAWGPVQANITSYLYFDISFLDASITFGYTILNPYSGLNAPTNPQVDQHWFDTKNVLMKVWNGSVWQPKLRLFAATYTNNSILEPKQIGSQIGLNTSCKAGFILKGKNNYPLRDGDGTFVTSESDLVVAHTSGENVKFSTAVLYAEAVEYIPAYSAVSYIAPRKVQKASFLNTTYEVNGVMTQDYFPGEVGNVVSSGLIENAQWDFADADVNKPLFVSQFGEITLNPPPTGITQEIGYVYDNNAIIVNIQLPILM